ncbi:hypothetical protein DL765_004613 [Monosporascus sp. GIB2]|nr:hypothetical protein DL765_004613 [Monosporascus sp. GIB2]
MENATRKNPLPFEVGDVKWDGRQLSFLVFTSILAIYVSRILHSALYGIKAPVVGYRSTFEPGWLVGLRFVTESGSMITDGYRKFKNSLFKIRRNDGEILIIPNKHVEELRSLPEDEVSGMDAHVKNITGWYTTGDILLEGDLPTRVIQQKLTPNLNAAALPMKDELDYALQVEMPDCRDEWVSVSIYDILLRIVARVSARVLMGPVVCRDEEWVSTAIHFTENSYVIIFTLRFVPSWMHPIVARLLPAYWRVRANLATAKRIIVPIVEHRRAEEARLGKDYQKEEDLLQWMMDVAGKTAKEGQPGKLAHRQLMLTLAGIHTTSMSTSHAIYDLCAHPEFFEPLREELTTILRDNGGWRRPVIPKFKKLDSFLKESQRINPPALVAFNRIARVPFKLSDGTYIPAGTHFAMASDAILNDPDLLPGGGDPKVFDPFRWIRLREDPSHPENLHRYQFAATDANNLHFGHGKYACPGRFFAGQQIKMILGHLLLHYDFKYPEGQGRPLNLCSDENVYPDPAARVLIRKRRDAPLEDAS